MTTKHKRNEISFEATRELIALLKSLASHRFNEVFAIKSKFREQADKAVIDLLEQYEPYLISGKPTEFVKDALHGIKEARKTMRKDEVYCLANFLDDLEYYSDRWCLWRVTRIMVLWEHVIRLN